jgi:energy-coupling factor transport system permease protein
MPGLEFFRNLSIGQYVDRHSPVHALRPATKYLGLFLLFALALAAPGVPGILILACLALGIAALARIPALFLLGGILPALPLFGIAAILQLVFAWPGDDSAVLVRLWILSVTARELATAALVILRSSSLILVIGLFTSVTPESQIAHGIEDFLAPLRRFGLRPQRIALAATTAFRFVPIIAGEIEDIVKAQSSRGADFGTGRGGIIAKARAYLPLFVPVTVRALERAQSLALAMEARLYTETGRSRYRGYRKVPGENVARAGLAAFVALALALDIYVF